MERLHANRQRSMVALRVVLILGLAGCSNKQMSASNPFMSPDRVPPPATRTIAPGTAAPYYPGDPVPAAAMPPAPPVTPIAAQAQPPMTQPQFAQPQVAQPPITPVGPVTQQPAAQPLAFSNERSVAIPTDNQDLRFAAPQQQSQPPITAIGAPASVQQAAATAPASPQVIPAAYNQPFATQPDPAASLVPTATADDNSGGPWRSPQVPGGQSSGGQSPVMQAQYVQPQPQQPYQANPWQVQPAAPAAPSASTMPVQLQQVPSPTNVQTTAPMAAPTLAPGQPMAPAQQYAPAGSPPPRMRFPSWTDPTTWFTPQPATATAPQPGQQLVGYMVPGPNGQMQMVSVEQMQAMSMGTAQSPANVATSDGFRARGTATK